MVIAGNSVLPFNHPSVNAGINPVDTLGKRIPAVNNVSFFSVSEVLKSTVAAKGTAGFSKQGRPIEAWYFPGTSNKRALIIGGVHGSELSAVSVARKLVEQLSGKEGNYYSAIVIPCLFPDNAIAAAGNPEEIGSLQNIGRYSFSTAADPNRQMPSPGKAFNENNPVDYMGRPIEPENQLLLRIIEQFNPQRIVNLHAIRDTSRAGIYADPRTNSKGLAFEYGSDSSLAIDMASYIENKGGYVPGNHLNKLPSALYYCDPVVAAPGQWQKRNLHGSKLNGKKGEGVSLGTWAATAVDDAIAPRNAIRLLTLEFPGCKRPQDYTSSYQQEYCEKNIGLYAEAICYVFLADNYVEK